MNKLRLTLEDLRIDSFSTTPVKKEKGTVYGEQCTCPTACTCPGCPTCDASCNGTCAASCNGTCDASCNGGCGTAEYSCDYSCAGTCVDTCMGCEYTGPGFMTAGGPDQHCIICAG
jgi:hypothetical protein